MSYSLFSRAVNQKNLLTITKHRVPQLARPTVISKRPPTLSGKALAAGKFSSANPNYRWLVTPLLSSFSPERIFTPSSCFL